LRVDRDVVPVLDLVELLRADTAGTMPGMQRSPDKEQFEQASLPQILIVDDSLSVRKSLSQLVRDAGFQPLIARDGIEALEVMQKQKPDLVLTDLEMPRMSGLELSAHIRASEETRDLPVIMVTSRTMQKHRDEAERWGVDLYVSKPFAEDDLIGSIHSILAG
jgi:chemosensory pili system protein ChpA (sensor histidine kinase/response regulator)